MPAHTFSRSSCCTRVCSRWRRVPAGTHKESHRRPDVSTLHSGGWWRSERDDVGDTLLCACRLASCRVLLAPPSDASCHSGPVYPGIMRKPAIASVLRRVHESAARGATPIPLPRVSPRQRRCIKPIAALLLGPQLFKLLVSLLELLL